MKNWSTPEIKELKWEDTMAGITSNFSQETSGPAICAKPKDQVNVSNDGFFYPYACALDS